jgi:DNA invertase Pin-like site-specific DNA recombinase
MSAIPKFALEDDFDAESGDVVIYARYSSEKQNDQSIEGQLRYCYEYAARRGFRVIGEYIDKALSGTKADTRPEFQRMISDARKRQFKYVLVWKLDRFARNRYDSAIYKNELKKSGVRVVSVTEGIGDGNESIILEAVLEAMAEEYSRQLRKTSAAVCTKPLSRRIASAGRSRSGIV